MYQRAAKKKPAMVSVDGMATVSFFRLAKEQLDSVGYVDAAHYFEMVEDHLRSGKPLPTTENEVIRVLGL